MRDHRQQQLSHWLSHQFSHPITPLNSMNGDAGFRRYFRFFSQEQSYIAVDSPNETCNNDSFVAVCRRLEQAGVCVPKIIAYEQSQGFFCLSDLGDELLSNVICEANMQTLYRRAIDLIQTMAAIPTQGLPDYDADFIRRELAIFPEWLLATHLNLSLTAEEQRQLEQCFERLVDSALSQPKVFMHRDFHSRNLLMHQDSLAVIDFQDAVLGPITYDVVSLLKDCYLKWPTEQVNALFDYFLSQMTQHKLAADYSKAQWQRWFDLMGLQRHLKAAGIFARLYHRDNKPGYLPDIPLTLSYVVETCQQYPEFSALFEIVTTKVLPSLAQVDKVEG